MKVSNNFVLQEFVSKDIYEKFGDRAEWFVDPKLYTIAQFIRNRFERPMIINNWHSKKEGAYNYRGFREPTVKIGAALSQHRFGRGLDHSLVGIENDEVYQDILDNEGLYYNMGVRALEDIRFTSSWVHIDIRPTNSDNEKIKIIQP